MEGGVLLGGYVILTDSSCDLPPELAEELQLQTIPLTFTVGGKNYLNYLDERELSIQYFYGMLRHGQAAYTSAVNIEAFRAYMEPILSAGEDILFLSFSSALSATFQNSLTAASMLSQQYPERKIHCVDTRCASLGQGLLAYLTAERRDEGANLDEATAFADPESEAQIQQAISRLVRGKTLIVVAHRLNTIQNADQILVIDQGRLAACGRQEELLNTCPLYRTMWEQYQSTAAFAGKEAN